MNSTIKNVAKEANVSIATVSRVLNQMGGYSDQTRLRVLKAVKDVQYKPNAIARGLINKRTQTIGVLFPDVSSSFSSDLLHGIEAVAHQHEYSVVVCNTHEEGKRTMKCLQLLREKQVDGIIFASELLRDEYYEMLTASNIPVVLVSSETRHASVPHVKVDDKQASYDAVEYLIHRGHKRIAMISGSPEDPLAGSPRIEGYRKALDDYGITFQSEHLVHGDFKFDSGCKAMEILLERTKGITAIFTASDEMAIGVLSVAATHGIKIPEDLSVIGYDNVKLAEMVVPPLTTVHQPLNDMGRAACEKIICMIETGEIVESSIAVHRIMERQTVRTIL